MKKECKVDGCNSDVKTMGYCTKHYKRVWKYGDPNMFKQSPKDMPIRDRIIRRIEIQKNGCWVWEGSKSRHGYGSIGYNGKTFQVHRLMYELEYGKIESNMHVLHRCDNPACCNPKHLFIGTHKDNMHDMAKKKRSDRKKGIKLKKDHVIDIFKSKGDGITENEISKKYNITPQHAFRIRNKMVWKKILSSI